MNLVWSPHAKTLLVDILRTIATECSPQDAWRWDETINEAVDQLAAFPNVGSLIPEECFHTTPADADCLRQLVVKPYRIVYEALADEIHILSIRHSRMLVTADDTRWH